MFLVKNAGLRGEQLVIRGEHNTVADTTKIIAIAMAVLRGKSHLIRQQEERMTTMQDRLYKAEVELPGLRESLRVANERGDNLKRELDTERTSLMLMLQQDHQIITPEMPDSRIEIPLRVITAIGFFSQFIREKGMIGQPWGMDIFYDRTYAESMEATLKHIASVCYGREIEADQFGSIREKAADGIAKMAAEIREKTNSLIGAQNTINMVGRALTGHPILDDNGPTFGRDQIVILAEDKYRQIVSLTNSWEEVRAMVCGKEDSGADVNVVAKVKELHDQAAVWETLAKELGQAWWWCHNNNANLQHGDISPVWTTFSVCLLGGIPGPNTFHAQSPMAAVEKAKAHLAVLAGNPVLATQAEGTEVTTADLPQASGDAVSLTGTDG
jgi:hypothetical protein